MRKLTLKRKLTLILIALIACASTCIPVLLIKNKNDKPIPSNQSKVTEAVCGKSESSYTLGKISYYNRTYCEKYNPVCRTASGEIFDDTALTCACSYDYQLGTLLKVSYGENSVVVRCNDRGSFESMGRTLDMSEASFEKIAPKSKGVVEAKIEVVKPEYEQINQYRATQGLSKLTRNTDLEKSAYESAEAIYKGERSWSHDKYEDYIGKYYKHWTHLGENLAKDYSNFDSVISAWHVSEKHRENMQSKDFCDVGIGFYKNIVVLHLGKK